MDYSNKEIKDMVSRVEDADREISLHQKDKSLLDDKIKKLKITKEKIRDTLSNFMLNKGITVYADDDFGEISLRKSPDKYIVKDEDLLMGILLSYDKVDEFCESVTKIDKRKLNIFFRELRKCDSLPGCVEIESGSSSLVFKLKNKELVTDAKKESNKSNDGFSLDGWDSV